MALESDISKQKKFPHIFSDTNPSNFIIRELNRRMPNCTTVVQTTGDLFELEI